MLLKGQDLTIGEHHIPIVIAPSGKAETEGDGGLSMAAADRAYDVMIRSSKKRDREM